LNIDVDTNKERQDCKVGTVCMGYVWEGEVNGGDEGEGIWWRHFIYLHEIEETSCNCCKWGGEGVEGKRCWE
jgi:hypothetical protein